MFGTRGMQELGSELGRICDLKCGGGLRRVDAWGAMPSCFLGGRLMRRCRIAYIMLWALQFKGVFLCKLANFPPLGYVLAYATPVVHCLANASERPKPDAGYSCSQSILARSHASRPSYQIVSARFSIIGMKLQLTRQTTPETHKEIYEEDNHYT